MGKSSIRLSPFLMAPIVCNRLHTVILSVAISSFPWLTIRRCPFPGMNSIAAIPMIKIRHRKPVQVLIMFLTFSGYSLACLLA